MTTPRKDPAGAGVYVAARASAERCHEWLRKNSPGPPACSKWLTPEQRDLHVEHCNTDAYTMAMLGAPSDEDPDSPCALVRQFLLQCLATIALEERPEQAAKQNGQSSAAFFDDSKTREALILLERYGPRVQKAAQLLVLEVESREAAIAAIPTAVVAIENGRPVVVAPSTEPVLTLGDFDIRLRGLARTVAAALDALMAHARTVMDVDAPRTLAEFNSFRSEWSTHFREAKFEYDEVQHFLGYKQSSDPGNRARRKRRIRQARRRRRGGVR